MYGAINLNDLINCGDVRLIQEFFGDSRWRILPLDTKPEDKFVAEMVFGRLDHDMFPGSTVAHGHIYNDSRGIFRDGDRVRTSTVKRIVEIDGELYIETRNTMYKLIEQPERQAPVCINTIMRDHDERGFQPK
jgi:hypothetical protein